MKNKIKTRELQMKAMFLAGVLMFESIFASVVPVAAQTISENEVTEEISKSKNLQVQEEKVLPENATIKYSGTDGKLDWSLDENGHLTISGNGDYEGEPTWLSHKSEIISATVTVTNITSTYKMFYNCFRLTSLDISKLDTSNVTDMSEMFGSCSSLMNLDVSKLDTSSVTNMDSMFCGCSSLTSLDLSNFITSNVTDMSYMFGLCSSLKSLDLRGFNTSNVTSMGCMFSGCSSLTSLDVSKLDTSNVSFMGSMFYNCSSLTSLDVSKLDTSSVTNMYTMFYGCSSLTSLDVSKLDTSNVANMDSMFGFCSSLMTLDLSSWDLSALRYSDNMLNGMDGLVGIVLPQSPVEIVLPGSFYAGENGLVQTVQPNSGKVTCISPVYADSYCGTNGHTYCAPVFTWADDYSSATLYMEGTREDCAYDIDDKHLQMDAVVTKETIQPTTEKEGATVYTATAVHKGKTYTDVKRVTIPKLPQNQAQPQAPTSPQNPAKPQTPTSKPIGTSFKTSTTLYRVTKSGKTPEISYMGPKNKKVKKVTIPATVKIDGVTYKVTSVADGALKNYKNLTQVTVGKNVTKIGKNAFYGCKKLKKIVIKGKNLKTVGKNAFKGIQKNAVIDVPNSKKKAYKKLFKAKTGYKKTMKVK